MIPEVLRENADYRRTFLGNLGSSLGTAVSTIAFPLLVLALGGSAVQAGSIATVSLGTRLAFRLPAGLLVDRWNRRTVALATDLVRCVALGSVPLAASLGAVRFWQLILVAAVEGLATALFGPAVSVLTRDVVSGPRLAEALGLDQAVMATTSLLGPALGGALFVVGHSLPFTVDAASYVVSAVLLWRVTVRPARAETKQVSGGMTAGMRWLREHRELLHILLYASVINLVSAAIEVMVVLDLRTHGEPGGRIGLVLSCAGIGAVLGSFAAPRAVARLSVPTILLGIGGGWTVVLLAFGVDYSPWQTAALLTVLMVLSPAAGVVVGHALFSRCPRELVGRVSAATSILLSGLAALGPIMAGALFQELGGRGAWLLLGGVTAAVTLVSWNPIRAASNLEAAPEPEPVAVVEEDLYEVVAHASPAPAVVTDPLPIAWLGSPGR
jgi:MFS family permease